MISPQLTALIEDKAHEFGIEPAAAFAVLEVESGPLDWVQPDGEPLTRLELHRIHRCWITAHLDALSEWIRMDKRHPWKRQQGLMRESTLPAGAVRVRGATSHIDGFVWVWMHSGKNQHAVQVQFRSRLLSLAAMLPAGAPEKARNAVFAGASYGGFQVMGFNFLDGDHDSAEAMAVAYRDPSEQVRDVFRRFLARPNELKALRDKDWDSFTGSYNGRGQIAEYSPRIADAYRHRRAA